MRLHISASFLSNFLSACICIGGYFSPVYRIEIMNIGLYALSGGITNWLAIYMLFEKVPFLYGSGVIPNRFEDFKIGIKSMLINQFFRRDILEKFLQDTLQTGQNTDVADSIRARVDLDKVYDGLVAAIMGSSFGGMLGMMGGAKALEPLKDPIKVRLAQILDEIVHDLKAEHGTGQDGFINKVEQSVAHIIDQRLAELTPRMVKNIIHDMIHEHLGWLVVWGTIMGGLMGLGVSLINM